MSVLGHEMHMGLSGRDRLDESLHTNLKQYYSVYVDVEGKCNLRCVYCSQSDKDFKPHDGMSFDVLDKAIEFAKSYGRDRINITSEGEFTFAKNWMEIAERLLQSGLSLSCTTNMARKLDADEMKTLSRFNLICVSLDSADPKILMEIRRSASISTITYNIMRIISVAVMEYRTPPQFIVNCVLSTKNALSIADLCSFCYTIGVNIVNISPLHNYGIFNFDKTQLGDERVEDPVEVWSIPELEKLDQELVRAKSLAEHHKRCFIVNDNIIQRLLRRLDSIPLTNQIAAGETRICVQPWERVFIRNNGGVMPCCYGAEDIGNIHEQGIEAVVHGDKLNRLKRSLLTGIGLGQACLNCDGSAIGKVEELRESVKNYLASIPLRKLSIITLSIQRFMWEVMEVAEGFSGELPVVYELAAL